MARFIYTFKVQWYVPFTQSKVKWKDSFTQFKEKLWIPLTQFKTNDAFLFLQIKVKWLTPQSISCNDV